MAQNVQILRINQQGSDGDGRKWPKHHLTRNDEYFLERIAEDKWIKDLPGGPQPGVKYRLDKLPQGYAGFEKHRPDQKHVDRYIYGHPNGQFRSLNEFYPHFKYLMDYGGPAGCPCKQCSGSGSVKKRTGNGRAAESGSASEASESQPQRSRYFAQSAQHDEPPPIQQDQLISPVGPTNPLFKLRQSGSEPPRPQNRKAVDVEEVPDIYEAVIEKMRNAGPDESVDEPIEERMSPDWRTGNSMTQALLAEWSQLPKYVPRTGEIVLFVRRLDEGESITWHKPLGSFCTLRQGSDKEYERPQWEAGVVTQMPTEAITDQDLLDDENKEKAVMESGFRIEPIPEPGNNHKPYSKQYKYVSLHAIRPLYLWLECLRTVPEDDWHPTIRHAHKISSSFCVIGRYRFRGVWPNATVFSRGVYIGPELIVAGDTVRLLPRKSEQRGDAVTDVMVVTAVRLRFVNLDLEDRHLSQAPPGIPYQTCLHISGRVYTLDPTRSFDRIGKVPIDPQSGILPNGLHGYGQWYHYSDPKQPLARIELPYTRILGRCVEDTAMKAWFDFTSNANVTSFQAVNKKPVAAQADTGSDISHGLAGALQAREYSTQHDTRIVTQEGKTWFWADTRVEQLDLHEVNNQFVGVKDQVRSKVQMGKWRASLKALDGKKGSLEAYQAANKVREQQEQAKRHSSYGMVAGSADVGMESTTEPEKVEGDDDDEEVREGEEDAMEVDRDGGHREDSGSAEEDGLPPKVLPKPFLTIDLTDSDDEDEATTKQLAGELAKNIRPNDSRPMR